MYISFRIPNFVSNLSYCLYGDISNSELTVEAKYLPRIPQALFYTWSDRIISLYMHFITDPMPAGDYSQ